jgi:hypothetical protein
MAVANRAVDAVMGPRTTEVVHKHEGEGAAPAAACAPAEQDRCKKRDYEERFEEEIIDYHYLFRVVLLLPKCKFTQGSKHIN